MARFEQTMVTSQPAELVFAFLSNPENDPSWSSASRHTRKTSPGPIDVGATFEQAGRFLGRRLALSLEVTAYEPNRRFGMKVASGPIKFAGVREVKAVPDGTLVTFTGGGRAPGPLRIAEPLLSWAAGRQLGRDLARLKEVLEGLSSRAPSASKEGGQNPAPPS